MPPDDPVDRAIAALRAELQADRAARRELVEELRRTLPDRPGKGDDLLRRAFASDEHNDPSAVRREVTRQDKPRTKSHPGGGQLA
jgi:hypothetical protein